MNSQLRERRKKALSRLQTQIKEKTKTTKQGKVPLTEKDIRRINHETSILTKKLTS